jgi:hypothetical protein
MMSPITLFNNPFNYLFLFTIIYIISKLLLKFINVKYYVSIYLMGS